MPAPKPPFDYSMGPSMAVGDEGQPLPILNPGEKYQKEAVGYRYARDASQASCGLCKNFDGESGCRKVVGLIRPTDWCRLFEAKASGQYEDYDADDLAEAVKHIPSATGRLGCGHRMSDECECEQGASMATPYGQNPRDHRRRIPGKTTFDQGQLLKLIEHIRRQCDQIESAHCGPDAVAGQKAVEGWRQMYRDGQGLRQKLEEAERSVPTDGQVVASKAIAEWRRNYKG